MTPIVFGLCVDTRSVAGAIFLVGPPTYTATLLRPRSLKRFSRLALSVNGRRLVLLSQKAAAD